MRFKVALFQFLRYDLSMAKSKFLDNFYHYALAIRGFDGFLDLIFGGLIYFSSSRTLVGLLLKFLSEELLEDPHDFIANRLLGFAQSISVETRLFIALYLAANGLIKLFLALSLWFKKQWIYPAALVLLLMFIFYQTYRLSYNFSWLLLVLIIFDLFIAGMVFKKYRQGVKEKKTNPDSATF